MGKERKLTPQLTKHYIFQAPVTGLFRKFDQMTGAILYTRITNYVRYLILDISNSVTWSFPEFMPFCLRLYYFSTFKDFTRFTQA
jgi:hypothetical protein